MRKTLQLYDTLSRTIKPLLPLDGTTLRLYTCGPTIYNFAHIGNFRTFLFEDILRRTLLLFGYKVQQVMNLTDVDDKTINGAKAEKTDLHTFTEKYKKGFFEDLETLRLKKAEYYPEATAYIQPMIDMIATLIEKKAAYIGQDKSVYFSIASLPAYGKLSHLSQSSLKTGASGVNIGDDYDKESIQDFVLWKAFDKERDGNVYWNSPWGKGRPGWHIECSVMAKELLGPTIDVHAGGVDLIFPHHENEIAQSETANGCLFSTHWAHSEHLMVDGKKMSKRFHNFYTLRDLLEKGYSKSAIRYLLISTHYRTPLNFTLQGIEASMSAVRRIREAFTRLSEYQPQEEGSEANWMKDLYEKFETSLSNDLSISEALAHIFEFLRLLNTAIDKKTLSKQEKVQAILIFQAIDSILDVLKPDEESIPEEITAIASQRKQAREEKNWKESDRLRALLQEKGYSVEDNPNGTRLTPIGNASNTNTQK